MYKILIILALIMTGGNAHALCQSTNLQFLQWSMGGWFCDVGCQSMQPVSGHCKGPQGTYNVIGGNFTIRATFNGGYPPVLKGAIRLTGPGGTYTLAVKSLYADGNNLWGGGGISIGPSPLTGNKAKDNGIRYR